LLKIEVVIQPSMVRAPKQQTCARYAGCGFSLQLRAGR